MEVGAHHRIPTLEGDRSNRSGELSAGIVDKSVYAAMGIQNSGNGSLHLVLVANVTGVCRRDPTVVGYFDCNRLEFFRRAADQSDDGAEGCELMGGAPADTAAKEDPNARVAVYLPGGDYGFGTASGVFGNTSQHTYQQQAGPNGSTQAINNPYGISIEGVASGNDPWRQRAGQELSWLDPVSYQQNTTLKESGLQPTPMSYKPGDAVAKGTANVPTMSKALYDWNMKVYGNPYGAGYNQQYIGGPTPTPLYPGGGG